MSKDTELLTTHTSRTTRALPLASVSVGCAQRTELKHTSVRRVELNERNAAYITSHHQHSNGTPNRPTQVLEQGALFSLDALSMGVGGGRGEGADS